MWEYWAKAERDGENFHPLPWHQLDVAAVGTRLLQRHPRLRTTLIELSGLPGAVLDRWLPFFLALHDLGKFSSNFQILRPDLAPSHCRQRPSTLRHDSLGYLLWREHTGLRLIESQRLVLTRGDPDDLDELLDSWALAVTGHHGQPPKKIHSHPLSAGFDHEDIAAADQFVAAVSELLLPESTPCLDGDLLEYVDRARPFSWWLAGFSVLVDWLGSNQDFFSFRPAPAAFADYWEHVAIPSADRAIDSSGLLPCPTAPKSSIQKLFTDINNATPLQARCDDIEIGKSPQLLILEDVTGAGKTEAAFVLLNRLLAEGPNEGAFLALPTMATSNAMYERTAAVHNRLFDNRAANASLILAHGGRFLNESFQASLMPESPSAGEYTPGEPNAAALCNRWLADGNKRALLAQMGVGTIDQALLAILTSRHQSLRLLGLRGKVLIVDEVHASDAYMHRLLCILLEFHAWSGGSAILLSATLPMKMRRELAAAFRRGLQDSAPELIERHYPLLSRVTETTVDELPVATREQCRRTLHFNNFHSTEDVIDWIVERARSGQCVVWIRNTVGDAIDARQQLASRVPEEHLDLFHARFAMGDRLDIERRIVARFGRDSTADERKGQILIATQVVEQSLDLDFDCMVSDLAPVDSLLQRAGRLRRHARDGLGNRLPDGSEDQRGPVRLEVLTPDAQAETDRQWLSRLLPGTAAVYPDHSQLWLTAWLIQQRRQLETPDELREWIEGVFSEEPAASVPEALEAIQRKAEGERQSEAAMGTFNSIRLQDGYEHCHGEWWDESHSPTRLGEPTHIVRLARWDGSTLRPWRNPENHPWPHSEIRVRQAFLAEAAPPDDPELEQAIDLLRRNEPKSASFACLLPLMQRNGIWEGRGFDETRRPVRVTYSEFDGLQLERENAPASPAARAGEPSPQGGER